MKKKPKPAPHVCLSEHYRALVKSGIGALVDACLCGFVCRLGAPKTTICKACRSRWPIERALNKIDRIAEK